MQYGDGLGCRVWRRAVEAPWQNGICERSGQTFKAVVKRIFDEVETAVCAAANAMVRRVHKSGYSPAQT
eukprot:11084208-Alexandrium_andersonii.AAC.1